MKTENLTLIPNVPAHLIGLAKGTDEYERRSGVRVADGVREFLLAGAPEFVERLQTAIEPDPWRFGFAIVHKIDNVVIGICGFAGPPDSDDTAEIAYSIAPSYQGKGYATEAAMALVEFASASKLVRTICAHTLPEVNASTRVLEKCGFKKTGEIVDPENNLVSRWERKIPERATSTPLMTKLE